MKQSEIIVLDHPSSSKEPYSFNLKQLKMDFCTKEPRDVHTPSFTAPHVLHFEHPPSGAINPTKYLNPSTMATDTSHPIRQNEHPPRADLQQLIDKQPLPELPFGMIDAASMNGDKANNQARLIFKQLNTALKNGDARALESCFYAEQAFWKDQLALTYHLRTFSSPSTIAASLLETAKLRDVRAIQADGPAVFLPVSPVLQFIECPILFKTRSPEATCLGKLILLPVQDEDKINWKIWVLTTHLESLGIQKEDEALLDSPGKPYDSREFDIDALIIGGGNAGAALSARLKALGVETVMLERNQKPGDNWALRYDSMRFHIPTAACELPYMRYDKDLQAPHLLGREELAAQLERFVERFHLNMINSAKIQSTTYDEKTKRWTVSFETPSGQWKVTAKQLVMATGIGSQKPKVPQVADRDLYTGVSIHSTQYKSASLLKEKGVKSAVIIGSANTAFDVLQDCYAAGLATTMVVRSPTYLVPVEDLCSKLLLGAYNKGVEETDKNFMTMPAIVEAQVVQKQLGFLASKKPERYNALQAAGFPVIDSRDRDGSLVRHIYERAGGHYIDVGGTKLISEGKVGIKAGAEPIAYTETGIMLSDGSHVEANAVIWCTGFSDTNASHTAAEILGGSKQEFTEEQVLGPHEIAARMDATWGVDEEGEIRGMWKRHQEIENFWVMGGHTQHHRWYSRILAMQIKAALEGILPPGYRETPE